MKMYQDCIDKIYNTAEKSVEEASFVKYKEECSLADAMQPYMRKSIS